MPATTWDANNKSAGFALSGGNLVATSSALATVAATRALTGPTYFEITVTTLTGTISIGLVNRSYNMASGTILGTDLNGIGYKSSGVVVINNATVATLAAYAQGNVIGVAVDVQNRLIWFRVGAGNWNNDVIANQNPVGSVGGISYAGMTLGTLLPAGGCSATGAVLTANFTGAFANAAPTGYITADTCAATAVNGDVPKAAGYSTVGGGTYHGVATSIAARAGSLGMGRSVAPNGGAFTPAGPVATIAGVTEENGALVNGKTVMLFDAASGLLLGSAVSAGAGAFSIPALGRGNVLAVAFDPTTYQAIAFDRLTPL